MTAEEWMENGQLPTRCGCHGSPSVTWQDFWLHVRDSWLHVGPELFLHSLSTDSEKQGAEAGVFQR